MTPDNAAPVGPLSKKKRSRKRWLTVWTLLGVLGGFVYYHFEPRVYQASTAILIVPQHVPVNMVTPIVTTDLYDRLNTIQQQILSRTRLERIVQEFNLYERERREMIMEDIIERMRSDISVSISRPRSDNEEPLSFTVSFQSPDARTAMRATERLASLFVQENLEDRELRADQTDQFLKGELEGVRRRLLANERVFEGAARTGRRPSQDVVLDNEVLQEQYKTLSRHANVAALAVNLERRQIGEQFKIIDGARLPEKPIAPRPFPYLALGALTGLGVGVSLSLTAALWRRRHSRKAHLSTAHA